MKIELVPSYENHAHLGFPYTHTAAVSIPSAGTISVYKIPALHLIMQSYFDKKTGLPSKNIKLTFRPNGSNEAILNFPHAEVEITVLDKNRVRFKVYLHAIFNSDNVVKETYRAEAELGGEIKKIATVKGGGSYERSVDTKSIPVTLHVLYTGVLYITSGTILVSSHIQ